MIVFKKTTLYCTYVALSVIGLNYHFATPFIHLAVLASCLYLIGALLQKESFASFSAVEVCWLLVLLVWPALYGIAYLYADSYSEPQEFSNLLRSAFICTPIFLTLRQTEIKNDHLFIIILLAALTGGVVSSYYNFFISRSAENFALATGGINLSIIFAVMLGMLISTVSILSLVYISQEKRLLSWVSLALVLLGISALFLTGSRGALAAICIPLLIFGYHAFKYFRNRRRIIFISLMVIGLATPFIVESPVYKKSLSKFNNFSALGILGERYHVWVGILESLQGNLLWGVGVDEDKKIINRYMKKNNLPENYQTIGHVHNDFLQSVFNFGLLISLFMFSLFIYIGGWAVSAYMKTKSYVNLLPFMIILSFMISGLSDVVILQAPSMLLFVLLMNFSLVLTKKAKSL